MTKCNAERKFFQGDFFPFLKRRKIKADFDGGNVTGDGGVLLLRQVEKRLGLLKRMGRVLESVDGRQRGKVVHDALGLLTQRVYGIALGYEDLNDHDALRHDIAWQTAAGKTEKLAGSSTLCRFENATSIRKACLAMMEVMVDVFIESFDGPPEELILDFDNTDAEVHGGQEGRFFHGYYDEYCFLPLYVFCGDKLVLALLQPSEDDGAKHAGAVLKFLVDKLRRKWPAVRIVYRGDSGFARKRHLRWCERNGVDYIVGLAKNNRLEAELTESMCDAEYLYQRGGGAESVRLYKSFKYSAGSWRGVERRVVGKAEFGPNGGNPRFVLTTLGGEPKDIYETFCARGNMENRIKEQKLGLFSDRMSAHSWWTNQFRMLLSAAAYILLEEMRSRALAGTRLAKAQVETIRLKLLKIGAVVRRNTRSITFHLSSACPFQDLFWRIASIYAPPR